MTQVYADHYPRTISQYVPVMEFSADVIGGEAYVNLGSPSAADTDGILDGVSATNSAQTYTSSNWATTFDGSSTHTGESQAGKINANFGRALTCVGTAGSNHVITITGRDYLGQIMSEALTLSGTSIIYGQKAFSFVDTVAVASGASGDTFDMGWSDVLGLPYTAFEVAGWKEDDVEKGVRRSVIDSTYVVVASDASLFTSAHAQGFIVGMSYVSAIANSSTANVSTLEIGGTAVAGLTLSVASGDSLGASYSDVAGTDDHGLTGKIALGGAVELVSDTAGTNGAGYLAVHIDENVRFIDGDTTTATTTTGDSRGTVLPYTSCDGSITYKCRIRCNTTNLHGVAQA